MGIKAYQQIEALSVTRSLLSAAVQTELDQIATNTSGIQGINDKIGAASGIAPLGADSKIPVNYLPAASLGEFAGEVADEAGMAAVTAQQGDWVYRQDTGTHWMLSGADSAVASNWREFTSPDDGVISLRNVSGTITGQQGTVTLADVAFSGAAADITGLSAIATSGSANDASYSGTGTNYLTSAANAGAALTALDAQVKSNTDGIATAAADAVTAATLVQGTITGTKDGSNNAFSIGGVDTAKAVFVYRDGIEQLSSGFATRSGANLTTVISAPESDEAMVVFGYPAAA